MITITPAAQAHFVELMRRSDNPCMTMTVKVSGCNGYAFDYEFKQGQVGSTKFEWLTDDGRTFEFFLEPSAVLYLEGGRVDLVHEGLNKRLAYESPLMTGQCGCGKSFSV